MDLNKYKLIDLRLEYYGLRSLLVGKLDNEVFDTIKELYKTQDIANITIAIEIMKSKLK